MEIQEFGQLFQQFRTSAFRLETRDRYQVDEEQEILAAYLSGEYLPRDPNADWLPIVREATAAGKSMSRVHIVPRELTPYLRFEIAWAYLYSAREGEEVYLLHDDVLPVEIDQESLYDFWIFDDEIVVEMQYDDEGRFVRPVRRPDNELADHLSLKERLVVNATSLRDYLKQVRTS